MLTGLVKRALVLWPTFTYLGLSPYFHVQLPYKPLLRMEEEGPSSNDFHRYKLGALNKEFC